MSGLLLPLRNPLVSGLQIPGRALSNPRLGPELLVNGDFNAGQPPWIVEGADGTHIVTFDGATCRYQSDTTSPVLRVNQVGVLKVGSLYRITVTVSVHVSGNLKTDNFSTPNLVLTSTAGPGTFTVDAVANSSTFAFLRSTANVDQTLDSISIRQILT